MAINLVLASALRGDRDRAVALMRQPGGVRRRSRSTTGAYVVQLSARRNETEARASFDTLQARYPRVLAGRQPIIGRADLRQRGVFFRAAVGPFTTIAEGNRRCGRSACAVS